MKPLNFPTLIYFDTDAFADLATYKGERILFVTSRNGLKSAAATRLYEAAANGNTVDVFNRVVPDPPLSVIAEGTEYLKGFEPTVIVALGGGSALDAAKAMRVDSQTAAKFIAVPTTSGTGSEINDLAVVTDDATGLKLPKLHPGYQPDKAYLIAELTVTMPSSTTIDTGMDVLTHALEAYVARPFGPAFLGHNLFTDPLAEKAVELVFANLPKVHENPEDLAARRNMLHASALASLAFIKAGLGGVHGISHSTGARLGLVHGRINSLLLVDLVQFNSGVARYAAAGHEETAARYASLAARVNHDSALGPQNVDRLTDLLSQIKDTLGIEQRFTQLGVAPAVWDETVPVITKTAVEDPCTATNPRQLGAAEMTEILGNLK